jgi:hypothetical protein
MEGQERTAPPRFYLPHAHHCEPGNCR